MAWVQYALFVAHFVAGCMSVMRRSEKLRPVDARDAGLCAHCQHVKLIRSDREATFYLCKLSATDPRFAKYPTLPVMSCAGYEQSQGADSPTKFGA
jgi:hypothetical protein